MKTRIIGLCGRSGSGKGFVARCFERFGGLHIDTDKIYHKLLEPSNSKMSECTKRLSEAFGTDIIGADLKPDRKKLSETVFASKSKLQLLNGITHRFILEEVKRIMETSDAEFSVIDAPLLFESNFDKLCDSTVCVVCSDEKCIERITERDGIDKERALKRLDNQLSADRLIQLCDYTVVNDGLRDVKTQVKRILVDMELYHEL